MTKSPEIHYIIYERLYLRKKGAGAIRVLLINPKPKRFYKSPASPLGILSVASYLNKRGHAVSIADRSVNKINYKKTIGNLKPDIVGISLISYKSIEDAVKASEAARAKHIPVVWGGALASVIPETVLKHGSADFVVVGEGEITCERLLEALEKNLPLSGIDGLAYTQNGQIKINKDRAFANLADFPVLDWSLVKPSDYFQSLFGAEKMTYLYSAKGCPGQCTFCFNKGFNKCEYRKRPFDYCIEEIQYLVANTALDGVHFADELWCRNRKEMVENCDKLVNSGFRLSWGCNARIGTYTKEDFAYMRRSGCRWMFFGIESGSDRIQKEIKKGIRLDLAQETVNNCVNAGIAAVTAFIIGFPGETADDIKETIALAKKIPEAVYDCNFYFPVSGSEMCEQLAAAGKYRIPETLEEYKNLRPTEKIHKNFSEVPVKELKVIRAWFMWSTFARKQPSSEAKRYAFIKKAAGDALKGLRSNGFGEGIVSLAYDAQTLFGVVSALLLHPLIRKKYGLYRD